jgi:hypothetical protein
VQRRKGAKVQRVQVVNAGQKTLRLCALVGNLP